jgi:acetoin utilization protein AcuB
MFVHEIMRKPVTVIASTTLLGEAFRMVQTLGFRHLPVVDQGRLVGVLTDRDIRLATSSLSTTPHSAGDPVSLAMNSPVLTADPLDPIEDAARIIRDRKIGCLPVMDGGELVGILTSMDLLDALMALTGVTKPSSRLEVALADRPGELARLTAFLASRHVNIHSILTHAGADGRIRTVLRLDSSQTRPLAEEMRADSFDILWPLQKPWQH